MTLRAARKSKVQPSQYDRSKKKPKVKPGERYTRNSYLYAVHRACDKAFPAPNGLNETELKQWRKQHRWGPNRVRHTTGTDVRRRYGVEAAQLVLGHARADVTQIYAERDLEQAANIMREIG